MNKWTNKGQIKAIEPRQFHSMLGYADKLYIFGGANYQNGDVCNDINVLGFDGKIIEES